MRSVFVLSLFILACGPEPVEPPPTVTPGRVDPILAVKHLGFNASEEAIKGALGEPCHLYHEIGLPNDGEHVHELLYCFIPTSNVSDGNYTVMSNAQEVCAFKCTNRSHLLRVGFQFLNGSSISNAVYFGPVVQTD
jgi:hypothetical protein